MLIGIDKVIESFKLSGKPHWKLYYNVVKAAPNAMIAESDPSGDAGTNLDRLQQMLDMVAPGKYMVQFKKDLADNTGFTQTIFEIPGANNTPATPAAIGNPYAQVGALGNPETFNQILDAKLAAMKEQHKREMLEAQMAKEREELAELRKNDGAIGNFFNNYAPLLVQMFAFKQGINPGAVPGAQVGLSGFGNNHQPPANQQPVVNQQQPGIETEPEEVTQQKLSEVLDWLTQAEGSQQAAVHLLYTMKQKAQQNPQLLSMLKQFLIS